MIPVVVGIFLVIGNFLKGRFIIWPSSSYPPCGVCVNGLNNVPVLSYLLVRGR